jgi:DNA repair protein RadA/Sms
VGGARLTEPAADLATALALASAHHGLSLPSGVVAIGEIGLAGELRQVRDLTQRVAEAGRLGFSVAVVPGRSQGGPRSGPRAAGEAIEVVEVPDIAAALRLFDLVGVARSEAQQVTSRHAVGESWSVP